MRHSGISHPQTHITAPHPHPRPPMDSAYLPPLQWYETPPLRSNSVLNIDSCQTAPCINFTNTRRSRIVPQCYYTTYPLVTAAISSSITCFQVYGVDRIATKPLIYMYIHMHFRQSHTQQSQAHIHIHIHIYTQIVVIFIEPFQAIIHTTVDRLTRYDGPLGSEFGTDVHVDMESLHVNHVENYIVHVCSILCIAMVHVQPCTQAFP